MEPMRPNASNSGVFVRLPSRSGSAAALLMLMLQLLFTGLVPVADARAVAAEPGSWMGVHVEKPDVHHAAHDPGDCVFCVSLQLGAIPADFGRAPEMGSDRSLPEAAQPVPGYARLVFPSQFARAPPFAA